MALSMDEQRILDEIERGLASADPALATRMSSFGAPRRIAALRMRRLRLVASLMTLLVVASVSVVVYALVPFRTAADRHAGSKASSSPAQTVMTTPSRSRPSSAAASVAPANAAPASPVLGSSAPMGSAVSRTTPSARAGESASPVPAHEQTRGTHAQ
jgi:hypothetical protein